MAKKVTLEAIKALLDENSKMFLDEIKSLKGEVSSHKEELAAVRELHESAKTNAVTSAEAPGPVHRTFVDAVRKSMQSIINDENCKNEVIITNAQENGEDEKLIMNLCKTLDL
jgi:predicted sugar kinase